ncbi:hypothetical protein J7E71_23180 [Mesobacillus foraminis]|uniref:hypothetical protein n=1 Tax=Mesobacillus foraminis TaxID=279826 RepID=UPI001BED3860|nr:hypothetical protein [Mesobacillus foraminis]MBT2758778.1 hypothetical protein [Mesobacillus foraminis]
MAESNSQQSVDNNRIHHIAMVTNFTENIGRKAFILTPSYPFMFIGEIMDVMGDLVEIAVETTHFSQLEDRSWFIHVDNIEVFYIEMPGEPCIPELRDDI